MRLLLIIAVSYLLGSIPFGYLVVTTTTGADIRQTGSGGTGATNVSRRAGKIAGVLTLVLDASKGAAAVIFAKLILGGVNDPNVAWWVALAGIIAMLGHIFPVWLGFHGGKGVATGIGVFVMLAPVAVAGAGVIFLVLVWLTRYVSLGSILAALAIPLFIWLESFVRPVPQLLPTATAALCGAVLIVYAHRGNIQRLLSGTENKFGR